ncbi:GNAT family N-acetyltransferase [Falsihalocynthiibacter arcticus]|uniref:GNAT family N-acetyltransferase n=1 Tax=Falsihalocynthiibacter arcticus TaxID=1579316 RepID=UPI000578F40C|nr:GNAT family N-acetyltransferase [Falsihalocynthiibacter arcticus]
MTSLKTPQALAALHARSFTSPRPWSADEFASLLCQKLVFLVTVPSGFALGRAIAGEAELLTIAVAPNARRMGAGRTLMDLFENEAIARESTESFLEVAEDNLAALSLYRGVGYRESGLRRGYYRSQSGTILDAQVFRKTIGA